MRWPLVTRKRHDREVEMMTEAINNEFNRARQEGRDQVHAWARDLNYNLFNMDDYRLKGAVRAALQQAESIFNPQRYSPLPIRRVASK